MTKKEKLLCAVGALHLALVVCGAASKSLQTFGLGKLGIGLDLYSQFSGAAAGYGFFAPDVGSGLKAEFDVLTAGRTDVQRIEPPGNREAFLRVGNIISLLSRDFEREKARRVIVASWVGKMMAKNPGSEKVTLRLQKIHLPTMEEYRKGIRRDWEVFYRAEFVRNSR